MFLHLIGDALGSVCVIVSGLIIKYSNHANRFLADPISSLIISIIIIVGSLPIIIKSTKILLQYVPGQIDLDQLRDKILQIEHVRGVHELHVWQLDSDRLIGTAHINVDRSDNFDQISYKIKLCMHSIGIHNTTIQPEYENHIANEKLSECSEPLCEEKCHEKHCC